MERIVVTGLGVVSSIGSSLEEFEAGMREGRSGMAPAANFNRHGFDNVKACEVKAFDPLEYLKNTDASTIARSSQFSIAAARMALENAGFDPETLRGTRIPVIIGTTDGESQPLDEVARIWAEEGLEAAPADLFEKSATANLSNAVSREFGLTGSSKCISTACSAGNYAIGNAFDLLRAGDAQIAICGGSDSVCRKTYSGFSRLGTIAPEKCQPFDLNRKGILTGEGSGILVLETLSSAQARGAKIYAEVLGYGLSCDADHMVSPNKESVARCIRIAHQSAGITPAEVDYVCAHGTGTAANDTVESGAIKLVFGEDTPAVSSIKSMVGHSMGAASAIASIACILAIQGDFLPPTVNHEEADPDCVPDCVPNASRAHQVRVAQNNGFAFGGNNAITIYGAYQAEAV
ncbi:MAG: beta-ketoacyl-[acyl-carrier-protein] synthase family protein [Pseudomonadota bacterium]